MPVSLGIYPQDNPRGLVPVAHPSAIRTFVRLHSTNDPQGPWPDTLAADEDIVQEWDGIQMPAQRWCSSERAGITLRASFIRARSTQCSSRGRLSFCSPHPVPVDVAESLVVTGSHSS